MIAGTPDITTARLSTDASPKTDDTPWALVQRSLEAKQPFRELLPAFAAMGLTGEDVGVLLNDPTSQLRAWLEEPVEREAVVLHAVDPPPGEPLVPARRFGSRGLLGWLTGANKIEGLGLFTEADVFESHGVQFAVMPEPVRPVVFGEVVPLRVLALNCLSVPVHFGVTLEAQPGLLSVFPEPQPWCGLPCALAAAPVHDGALGGSRRSPL